MNVPPEGGGQGLSVSPSPHTLTSSPTLLKQLTSPSVLDGGAGGVAVQLPRSPLPPSQGCSPAPCPAPSSPALSPRPGLARTPHRSPATSPARKRLKLDLGAASVSPVSLKRKLFEWRTARLRRKTSSYRDNMAELFFLRNGTNVTENLPQFRRKPSQQFVQFLRAREAPARVMSEVQCAVLGPAPPSPGPPRPRPATTYSPHPCLLSPVRVGEAQDIYSVRGAAARPSLPSACPAIPPLNCPVYSPDQVGEKVKQEGWVVRRVAELSREGLWPARRLPAVAERPRPASAWDAVLEEMRWLAADFKQERGWKKAAARVQSAACREHVARRQEVVGRSGERERREIAGQLAGAVQEWWRDVAALQGYQITKQQNILVGECAAQQLSIVAQPPPQNRSTAKRKLSEATVGNSFSTGRISPEPEFENGLGSDCESSLSEQESWERSNVVADTELERLQADLRQPLAALVTRQYPGYREDVASRAEDAGEEEMSEWETDSECEGENLVSIDCLVSGARPVPGPGLAALSSQAGQLLPKSVISSVGGGGAVGVAGSLLAHQQTALDWLLSLHRAGLPALLLDPECGLGRKVTVAALLASLQLSGGTNTGPGPHLLLCPVTALAGWRDTLARWIPSLRVSTYSGTPAARRRLRLEISLSSPHIVLASYRTFFSDSCWFLTRPWSLLITAEIQNVISAGSSDQIRALVGLKTSRRILLITGALKENPIDLWNTLYMLFPCVHNQRGEATEVEVEGTPEFTEVKEKLLKVLAGFTFSRSRTACLSEDQHSTASLPLHPAKRKLYDDYLAQSGCPVSSQPYSTAMFCTNFTPLFCASPVCVQPGDLNSVCAAIQTLRQICSGPLERPQFSEGPLPAWCYLTPSHSPVLSSVLDYHPLHHISLDQVNLVFLSQELTTTGSTFLDYFL